jgi:hypothetical protein
MELAERRGPCDRHYCGGPPPKLDCSVSLLLLKLTLAPGLVAATTLAARRWGPRMGGWLGGLPVVVGPILLALALEHGRSFGATAATGALLGLLSLCAFMAGYAWIARVTWWLPALVAGYLLFAVATLLLDRVSLDPAPALAAVLACFALTTMVLPSPPAEGLESRTPPRWDLLMRALATAAIVLVITGLARVLGPHLSGLIAAAPILAAVLAAFTHAQDGAAPTAELLRGLVAGLTAFAVFCFVVAEMLPSASIALTFLVASLAAVASHGLALVARSLGRRRDSVAAAR